LQKDILKILRRSEERVEIWLAFTAQSDRKLVFLTLRNNCSLRRNI